MTTKHSPLRILKGQADKIAQMIKAAERGEKVDPLFARRIAEARLRGDPHLTVGVAMDDKFLKIEMKWEAIREHSEVGIAEYILRQMREARDTAH